jgi:P-type E1-E2 ATPase
MIQKAHVGVGIYGKEGLQAARSADFSIGQFKFLQNLLLLHGRNAYHRTAFIAQYCFYKSIYVALCQVRGSHRPIRSDSPPPHVA